MNVVFVTTNHNIPSSGMYQLKKSPHCSYSRVSITMLLLHVVVFEKFVLALASFSNISFIYICIAVQ
jgi:hypothetical protein